MLRRQRQLQVQLQKVVDAGLFCVALWVAHKVRAISGIEVFGGTKDIQPFPEFVWLFLVIFPLAPVWLQSQGFYNRPIFFSRRQTAWQLAKEGLQRGRAAGGGSDDDDLRLLCLYARQLLKGSSGGRHGCGGWPSGDRTAVPGHRRADWADACVRRGAG